MQTTVSAAASREEGRSRCAVGSTPVTELKVVEAGETVLCTVIGPLDIESAPAFAERMMPFCEQARGIVIDLTGAAYIDSSGVRALLALKHALDAGRGALHLVVREGTAVDRTLRLLQLDEQLGISRPGVEPGPVALRVA